MVSWGEGWSRSVSGRLLLQGTPEFHPGLLTFQDADHHHSYTLTSMFLFCVLFGQGLTCNLGWPGTHNVNQTGFKLKRPACLCLLCAGIKGPR